MAAPAGTSAGTAAAAVDGLGLPLGAGGAGGGEGGEEPEADWTTPRDAGPASDSSSGDDGSSEGSDAESSGDGSSGGESVREEGFEAEVTPDSFCRGGSSSSTSPAHKARASPAAAAGSGTAEEADDGGEEAAGARGGGNDNVGVFAGPDMTGWLFKRSGGRRPITLAQSSIGTWLQALFWQRRHFRLRAEHLVYALCAVPGGANTDGGGGGGGDHPLERGAFALSDIDEVTVQGREISIHFAKPQRTGVRRRERAMLGLLAPSSPEAERWGEAIRSAVAGLRTGLPTDWDVHAMLQKRGSDSVRLVAKIPLPEGAVYALQQLVDHSFVNKGTRDRRGLEVPLRLEVVEVFGVQNIAAWTEYTKARARMSDRALKAEGQEEAEEGAGPTAAEGERLQPDVRTATLEDAHVRELLGEADRAANEHWLFHGSTPEAVQNITNSEFQINLAGSHRGTLYGRGVYLAECCSKADEYAEVGSDGLYGMLLCRALLGRILVDPRRVPDVPELVERCQSGAYDSVCGDRWKAVGTFREFVLYDGNQVYPAYIIRYRRVFLERLLRSVREVDTWTDAAAALHLILYAARIAEDHPNATVRTNIPIALRTHVHKMGPAVVNCLKDARTSVRRVAAVALGMLSIDSEDVVSKLIERMEAQDEASTVRAAAIAALGQMGDSQAVAGAVTGLEACLGDRGEDVRCAAVKTLAQLGIHNEAAVEALINNVGTDAVRPHIVSALGGLGDHTPAAVPPTLAKALSDEVGDTRLAAARSLAQLGRRALPAMPELMRAVADDRADVRKASVQALIELGGSAVPAAPALVECLQDESDGVRAVAAEALGKLGKRAAQAVPALINCLHDESKDVRREAVVALGHMGSAAAPAMPAICVCLQDTQTEVVEAAQAVLDTLSTAHPKKSASRDKLATKCGSRDRLGRSGSTPRRSRSSTTTAESDRSRERKEKKGKKEKKAKKSKEDRAAKGGREKKGRSPGKGKKEKDEKRERSSSSRSKKGGGCRSESSKGRRRDEKAEDLAMQKLRARVGVVQPPPSPPVGSLLRRVCRL